MSSRNPKIESRSGEKGPPAVRARGLGFTYEGAGAPALSGVDLELPGGSSTAVVGASGAGKSTLCMATNGLVPKLARGRLEGDLVVCGKRVAERSVKEMARTVGIVLQDFEAQLFSTSAELEIAFGLENLGVETDRMRRIVTSSLEMVGLAGFERRDPSTLSGGEKQRVALAAVLAMDPPLIVLDEPTSDLDPRGRREVMGVLRRLAGAGRTFIVVEHETDELTSVDHVLLLRGGTVAAAGAADGVFSRREELRASGVRPPQLAELCGILQLDSDYRVGEVEKMIRDAGYRLDGSRCGEIGAAPGRTVAGPAVIEIEAVSYSYPDGMEALRGVSLEISHGEFAALIGVNGSGKTTLAKHFNGLLLPGTGVVRVRGLDTRAAVVSELSTLVGYVFQNPDHQIFSDTVAEELAFGPRNAGLDPEETARRSKVALEAVRMRGREGADPFALTKGERQRVALASVLVMEPSVIVMDEPTTGLDFTQQIQVMELLRGLNARGHTIIIVTHSLWLAAAYARRTIVMSRGRIAADGPTRQVMTEGEGLDRWSLVPPPIVSLARRMGAPAVTVGEMAYCLGVGSSREEAARNKDYRL